MSMRSFVRPTTAFRSAAAAVPRTAARTFASSALRGEYVSPWGINSMNKFSEEEEMLRSTVRRFAQDKVAPLVSEMDEQEKMNPDIIKGLFEQGLMAIETDPDHGGAGSSFTAAIIAIDGACSSQWDADHRACPH